MTRRGQMRASDLDREQVAERLRRAAMEGRLLAEELEQRLARALRARTYGELDELVADLPRPRTGRAIEPRGRSVDMLGVIVGGVLGLMLLPVIALVLALAAALISGLFSLWLVGLVVAWFMFSRGRRAGRRHQVRVAHRRWLL